MLGCCFINLLLRLGAELLPGVHRVPHDPRQHPHAGDPSTGPCATQVLLLLALT